MTQKTQTFQTSNWRIIKDRTSYGLGSHLKAPVRIIASRDHLSRYESSRTPSHDSYKLPTHNETPCLQLRTCTRKINAFPRRAGKSICNTAHDHTVDFPADTRDFHFRIYIFSTALQVLPLCVRQQAQIECIHLNHFIRPETLDMETSAQSIEHHFVHHNEEWIHCAFTISRGKEIYIGAWTIRYRSMDLPGRFG